MNWLANKLKVKSLFKPGLMLLIPVFFGCDTVDDVGTEINLNTNVNVRVIDFNLPATNVYIDSLRTDSEDRILVGNYTDPLTGRVSAQGYFQYTYSGGGTFPVASGGDTDTLFFDSLVLEIEVLSRLSEPAEPLEFDLFELQDSLQNVVYLASRSETLNGSAIANFRGFAENIFDENNEVLKNEDSVNRQSITIGMPTSYGQTFFDEISAIVRDVDQSLITTTFDDLAITPASDSEGLALLATISSNSRFTLFMDDPDDDSVYTLNFPLSGFEYSNISSPDRAATAFNGIQENQDFDLADGTTVVDPIGRIATAFSIREIESFFIENDQILINSATIELSIQQDIPRDTVDFLRFYFRKPDGGIFGPATAVQSLAFGNVIMSDEGYHRLASIPLTPTFDQGTYTASPTLFFQSLYNTYQDSGRIAYLNPFGGELVDVEELVIVSPTDLTLQQTIFESDGINLRVFYTEVD